MKKFISTLTAIFFAVLVMAQVPNIMNYQAVARNNAGQALANQNIKVKLTIEKNSFALYSETRQVTTNALGLFNVQIGSSGALSTTGNFSTINWQDNSGPLLYVLNVQLDINNSGLFTDMGNQLLATVPYAFASKTATETVNIGGKPVAQNMNPALDSRLSWNGTNWIPVKKDSVFNVSAMPYNTAITSTNWSFLDFSSIPNFTVDGTDRIVANLISTVGNVGSSNFADVSICYQKLTNNVPTGTITPFSTRPHQIWISGGNGSTMPITQITGMGAITLPAGSYRIGLAIKLVASGPVISVPEAVNGTIEIRY